MRTACAIATSVLILMLLVIERWRARFGGHPYTEDDDWMGY